jgi:hypothetical protein
MCNFVTATLSYQDRLYAHAMCVKKLLLIFLVEFMEGEGTFSNVVTFPLLQEYEEFGSKTL